MNTAIIMLGSNVEPETNLELAKEKLALHLEIVKESSEISSEPVGTHYHSNFRNVALKLLSDETEEETIAIFKDIEIEMGRTPECKKSGLIPIDIDLIFWNNKQIHTDYDRFNFVKQCIDEIK